MILIGLAGAKGSGKNTVGDYLEREFDFKQLSFAAPLKESAAACLGVDAEVWERTKNDPEAYVVLQREAPDFRGDVDRHRMYTEVLAQVTVREFLQRYGTEAHRDIFGEDFWTKGLGLANLEDGRYVITDMRFENETTEVIRCGGTTLYIDRDTGTGTDSHASEVPPPEHLIDEHIDNNGTMEELYARVRGVLSPALGGAIA
jgi:hypothetical protein